MRKADDEFEAILRYIMKIYLKTKQNKKPSRLISQGSVDEGSLGEEDVEGGGA